MGTSIDKKLPRGYRNNNFGNIRRSKDNWQGLRPEQTDPQFFQFTAPEWGYRALIKTLQTYRKKHNLQTIAELISRWAPANENNTSAYIRSVCREMQMPDPPRERGGCRDGRCGKGVGTAMRTSAIFLLYILALVCLLCGCKQVQYVPVETVRLDSIYLTQTLRDSIVRYDSVYVRDKGDTLYVERWKYLYRDKVRVDTMVSVRVDTLAVPYPVEKRLTRWERMKMEAGGYAIVAGCAAVLVVTGWMVYRIRRK